MTAPVSMHPEASDRERLVREPTVSVIMLAHNHAPYLEQAIKSVLQQVMNCAFELVIGEDCSVDATREIALRYQKAHPESIRVLLHPENVGMHGNHARLVEASRGEYLAYCEGDDYWYDPDKLQRQIDHLRARPECGAVHTDYDRIARFGERWRALPRSNAAHGRQIPSGEVFEPLLAGNFVQTCTLCVRTSLVRTYFDSGLPIATYPVGDWPLCLYVAHASRIDYLPESTAVYRHVGGSMMNSGHAARLRTVQGYPPMIESFCDRFSVGPATRAMAIRPLQRALLSLAVLAADPAAFATAWRWLDGNDPGYLRPLRRRLLPWIVRSATACRLLAVLHDVRAGVSRARRYRAPALPVG